MSLHGTESIDRNIAAPLAKKSADTPQKDQTTNTTTGVSSSESVLYKSADLSDIDKATRYICIASSSGSVGFTCIVDHLEALTKCKDLYHPNTGLINYNYMHHVSRA